jgi:hypothetical protein
MRGKHADPSPGVDVLIAQRVGGMQAGATLTRISRCKQVTL